MPGSSSWMPFATQGVKGFDNDDDDDDDDAIVAQSENYPFGVNATIQVDNNNNNKCTIVPVIIGATGILTRSLRKNLEAVPGKHSIHSL